MSAVGSIGIASAPSLRARLRSLGSLGRKSAGAAAMTSTSAAGSSSRTASSSCFVVSTSRRRTPIGAGERHRARDEDHVRPALPGHLRQPVAHLPARAVGDHAHRIDALARRPRRHHHAAAAQPARGAADDARGVRQDRLRLAHAAGPLRWPLGERAGLGADQPDAAGAQALEVGPRLRVRVHLVVHGRREEHGCGRGEEQRREEIVGQSLGHAGDEVRGGRRHEHEIGLPVPAGRARAPRRAPTASRGRGARSAPRR